MAAVAPALSFYDAVDVDLVRAQLAEVVANLPSGAALSHFSAWAFHGLPLPAGLPVSDVTVSSPPGAHQVRRRGVIGVRRRHPFHSAVVDGIRVTTPSQTWLDVAGLRPALDWYVAMGDALVGDSDARLNLLIERVRDASQFRGIALAREAVELVRCRAQSMPESVVRVRLIRADLGEPVPNVGVHDAAGRFIARVDLAFRGARVAVEYEGRHHVALERQYLRDIHRYRDLELAGWRVVRVTASDLADPAQRWLDAVRAVLAH